MPRSSATRVGNGPGWGGPAKGSPPRKPKYPDFEKGNKMSPNGPAGGERAARRRKQFEELMDKLYRVGMGKDQAQPVQVQAAMAFAAKVEPDKQAVDQTIIIKTGVPRADRD